MDLPSNNTQLCSNQSCSFCANTLLTGPHGIHWHFDLLQVERLNEPCTRILFILCRENSDRKIDIATRGSSTDEATEIQLLTSNSAPTTCIHVQVLWSSPAQSQVLIHRPYILKWERHTNEAMVRARPQLRPRHLLQLVMPHSCS